MVAVMVRVENILHRLVGDALGRLHGQARADGVVGVHHDEVILHLDEDVVAVTLPLDVALAEPDAGGDQLDLIGLRVRAGREEGGSREKDKGGQYEGAYLHGYVSSRPSGSIHPRAGGRVTPYVELPTQWRISTARELTLFVIRSVSTLT